MKQAPYYIVAPAYSSKSAGIVCLHRLCNALNASGQEAYLYAGFFGPVLRRTARGGWNTPSVTPRVYARHRRSGLEPIIVYPEIIAGNPLNANKVVRYFLNRPGFLGGEGGVRPGEFNLAYSRDMLSDFAEPDLVLHIPVIDLDLFRPPEDPLLRRANHSCYYLGRDRSARPDSRLIGPGSVEITLKHPKDKRSLAGLFQQCEYFVSYQSSSLCLEAALCGCVAVVMPNALAPRMLSQLETGGYGMAWGDSPEAIQAARATLPLARQKQQEQEMVFQRTLETFIAKTQQRKWAKCGNALRLTCTDTARLFIRLSFKKLASLLGRLSRARLPLPGH